jgi:hypothetical protein
MSDITRRLRGKTVSEVVTNGNALRIHTNDGAELDIVWLDDNGVPIKGKPAVRTHGARLVAKGMQELIHYPTLRTKGFA